MKLQDAEVKGTFSVDASKRGNFFTRLYGLIRYLFTGKFVI